MILSNCLLAKHHNVVHCLLMLTLVYGATGCAPKCEQLSNTNSIPPAEQQDNIYAAYHLTDRDLQHLWHEGTILGSERI